MAHWDPTSFGGAGAGGVIHGLRVEPHGTDNNEGPIGAGAPGVPPGMSNPQLVARIASAARAIKTTADPVLRDAGEVAKDVWQYSEDKWNKAFRLGAEWFSNAAGGANNNYRDFIFMVDPCLTNPELFRSCQPNNQF